MFCIVMQDKSICTTVLNMVLAQSIGPIIDLTYQKTFDQAGYAKGIRVDVWITDSDGNVFDVECKARISKTLLNACVTTNRLSISAASKRVGIILTYPIPLFCSFVHSTIRIAVCRYIHSKQYAVKIRESSYRMALQRLLSIVLQLIRRQTLS